MIKAGVIKGGAIKGGAIIIGGGPAGAAVAITLARAGHRPILIERTSHPTDKVCGDFLSADTIQRAQSLGVDPAAMGASPIRHVRLIHGELLAESALPFTAMGLSRRVLDAALLLQAQREGADTRFGHTVIHLAVTHPGRDRGRWTVRIGNQDEITTGTVFQATGKHDLRHRPRPGSDRGAIGMKMYFTLSPDARKRLDGAVELTLFPGGYAGMQPVEDGRTVLCIAVRRAAFKAMGGSWAGMIEAIGQSSHRFATMLAGSRALLPRPLAVAGIPYGYRAGPTAPDGLFRVGDQAAVIASLTGDGMAIALHSGKRAAQVWLDGGDAFAYHARLAQELGSQMRLASLLHGACMFGPVQSAVLRGAALFPGLLRRAASATRIAN